MEVIERAITQEEVARLADILMTLQRIFLLQLSSSLSEGHISFAQFFLLGQVSTDEALSMSAIAEKMNHTTAAATGLVDRLEKIGYVERTAAANDRRKVLVRLTSRGREIVDSLREDMIRKLNCVLGELTPEEQRMWLQIYSKIINYCRSCRS